MARRWTRAAGRRGKQLIAGLCCCCLLFAFPGNGLSQQPSPQNQTKGQELPVLRTTTRLVEISVIARGKDGKPVAGLTRDDFALYENGREQTIRVFSEERGLSVAPVPEAVPLTADVYSNRTSAALASPNVSVVLFDALNTHILDQQNVRRQIILFLKQLKPSDRVAIYVLTHGVRVLHDFTSDSAQLLKTLNTFPGAASFAIDPSQQQHAALGNLDFDDFAAAVSEREQAQNTRLRVKYSLAALEAIAHHLAPVPGRKNLIWVSGGFPLTMGFVDSLPGDTSFRDRDIFFSETQRAARAVSQANIAIYPVDARGLFTDPLDDEALRANMPFFATGQQSRYAGDRDYASSKSAQQREAGTQGGSEGADAGAVRVPRRELIAGRLAENAVYALTMTHDAMQLLADQTGGRAFYNRNDIGTAIREAIDETEVSYLVGYYPAHNRWDGRFHTLKLQVKKPGVTLRHRKGYFAYADDDSSAAAGQSVLSQAVASPLDARAVGVSARIEPRPGGHRITLQVVARDLWLQQEQSSWTGEMDVHFSLTDSRGGILWSDGKRVSLHLRPATFERAQREGLRLWRDVPAKPGAVLLRTAVRDARSGAVGSVSIPLRAAAAGLP
jgi:VWFA-related protein